MATQPILPDLPTELLQSITAKLSSATDLQNARVTCSTINAACITILFEHVTLVPYRGCLQRFITTFKHSLAAQHIKRVTYDDRWHQLSFVLLRLKERQLDCHDTRYLKGHHAIFEPEVGEFGDHSTVVEETKLLSESMGLLPSLASVNVIEQEQPGWRRSSNHSMPPWFHTLASAAHLHENSILSWNRVQDDDDEWTYHEPTYRHATEPVFASLRDIECENLKCSTTVSQFPDPKAVPHHDLISLEKLPTVAPSLMASLNSLEIQISNFNHRNTFIERLAQMLCSAVNLRSLKLSFQLAAFHDELDLDLLVQRSDCGVLTKRLASDACQIHGLQSLFLDRCVCNADDLNAFASSQSRTLRHITLRDVSLLDRVRIRNGLAIRPDENEPQRPCFVELFEHIRSLELESFHMSGSFWNGGSQRLDLSEMNDDPSVKQLVSDLKNWILSPHTEDRCPWDQIRVREDAQSLFVDTGSLTDELHRLRYRTERVDGYRCWAQMLVSDLS